MLAISNSITAPLNIMIYSQNKYEFIYIIMLLITDIKECVWQQEENKP